MDHSTLAQQFRRDARQLETAADALEGITKATPTHTDNGGSRSGGRHMSARGRQRIAAAQRARWAKLKRASRKAA